MVRDVSLGNPAVHPNEDQFNRWPFSRALADRIASLGNDEGAPVIGLYGRWGYGKSSVLNFIKYRLQEEQHSETVLLFEFNPWLFRGQEALLSAFYSGLGNKMGQSLTETRVRIGDAIVKYGSLLGGTFPGSGFAAKTLEAFGKVLKDDPLEDQHRRIVETMRNARRTIVVLIDDLDRLDRDEIMMMLKVVRLTANFPRVVYLLAFDDEVVAASLNASFGGNPNGGHQFLEKIIQLPFAIPTIGQQRFVDHVLRRARDACGQAGIQLNERDWIVFRDLTDRCLLRRLSTPRQAIRFGSALDFALPMLKGEVDPLQQMVLEGVRILFPNLYVRVRDNGSLFAGSPVNSSDIGAQIDHCMKGESADALEAANEILRFLFITSWNRSQPISDARYFDRYFAYALAEDEFTESEKLSLLGAKDLDGGLGALVARLGERNPAVLVRFVSEQLRLLSEGQSAALARELASCSRIFAAAPAVEGSELANDFAELLVELVRRSAPTWEDDQIPGEERRGLAIQIVTCLEPVALAAAFIRMLQQRNADSRTRKDLVGLGLPERIIHLDGWAPIHEAIVPRIRAFANDDPSRLFIEGSDGWNLFNDWRRYEIADLRLWVEKLLSEHPTYAVPLLRSLTGDMGDAIHWRFGNIEQTISPSILKGALLKYFGNILTDKSVIKVTDEYTMGLVIARHFLYEYERRQVPDPSFPAQIQDTTG